MNVENDYQITGSVNKEKKMAALRAQVLAKTPEKALDAILGSSFPASLVQSFPDQDLHFLMHHIGVDDFLPVLSLATSQQWEYLLDVEAWQHDRLDMIHLTRSLALLFKADPQRLLRWIITEKPDFLEYYFYRNLEIGIRKNDDDPLDFGEGFETFDNYFYFRFFQPPSNTSLEEAGQSDLSCGDEAEESDPFHDADTDMTGEIKKNAQVAEALISDMLKTLAGMDLSVYHAVMLETTSVIPAETEEEQFRQKSVRLAEKGFLPYHDAVAIYQPLYPADLKERPDFYLKKSPYAEAFPMPPQFHFSTVLKKNLFVSCLAQVEEDVAVNLQAEFAFLVNSVISTEKRLVRSLQDLEKSVEKSSCYLSIGLEVIHSHLHGLAHGIIHGGAGLSGVTQEEGAALIRRYALKDIFRVGSGAGLALKRRMEQWYPRSWMVENSLNLTFLGEKWLGITGGIMLDRPLYFDNYETGVLYRPFTSLKEIEETSGELDAIVLMDGILKKLKPDPAYLCRSFLTWDALFLTLWAKQCMGLDNIPAPVPLKPFKLFFEQLFSHEERVEGDANWKKRGESEIFQGKTGQGRISELVRQDFFTWLEGEKNIEKEELYSLNSTVRTLFQGLFDELECEYGNVASQDIDPELIRHFILEKRGD